MVCIAATATATITHLRVKCGQTLIKSQNELFGFGGFVLCGFRFMFVMKQQKKKETKRGKKKEKKI